MNQYTVLFLFKKAGGTPTGDFIPNSGIREVLAVYAGRPGEKVMSSALVGGRINSTLTALLKSDYVEKKHVEKRNVYRLTHSGLKFIDSSLSRIESPESCALEMDEGSRSQSNYVAGRAAPRVQSIAEQTELELAAMAPAAMALIEAAGALVDANSERRKLMTGMHAKIGIILDAADLSEFTNNASEGSSNPFTAAADAIADENRIMLLILNDIYKVIEKTLKIKSE